MNKDVAITFRMLSEQVNASLIQERIVAMLSGFFAGLALLLAGLGLYGVTSYAALHGLEPRDPATLALAALVLSLIGAMAGWIPARRAARIDPARVLREG